MLTAITRGVSPSFGNCELTFMSRQPIALQKAQRQQRDYEKLLTELGVEVISLPPEPNHPDAVFVEDTAVVVDEVAVVPTMGALSRRREVETIAPVLAGYRPLAFINHAGTLEGGDVVIIGRTCYVGVSTRTNLEGVAQLRGFLAPYDYEVIAVEVKHCLHLTTGCTYIGRDTVLANTSWVDVSPLRGLQIIDVSATEPWAANALLVGDVVVLTESSRLTAALLRERGFDIRTVDVSELEKAEAGLTCMSLIFDGSKRLPHCQQP
jgi:dimethylargininase